LHVGENPDEACLPFDVRAGFVSMDEATSDNLLQNLLLRFGIVSANSDFQIVQGTPIEVEAEQSIEAAEHYILRDAQLDNLVEEVCHQVPSILSEKFKSLIDAEGDPALRAAARLKDILYKTSL
jgi:hypothetical protein